MPRAALIRPIERVQLLPNSSVGRDGSPDAATTSSEKLPTGPPFGLTTFASLVLWGLLAGALGELGARYVLLFIRPSLIATFYLNPQAIWLGPLVNLPVFLIVAGGTYALVRSWRPRQLFAAVAFVVIGLVLFEIALVTARVHVAALALLAAGGASVLSRIAVRFPVITLRLTRLSAGVMGVVALGGGVALTSPRHIANRRHSHPSQRCRREHRMSSCSFSTRCGLSNLGPTAIRERCLRVSTASRKTEFDSSTRFRQRPGRSRVTRRS